MPQQWDCNLAGDLDDPANAVELIQECLDLGYHGVVLDYRFNVNDNKQHKALLSIMDGDLLKIRDFFGDKIDIRIRCTLKVDRDDRKSLNAIFVDHKMESFLSKMDVVAIAIDRIHSDAKNTEYIESVLKCKWIDIINLDDVSAPNRGLHINTPFKILIRTIKSKEINKYFEITLNAMKQDIRSTAVTVNLLGSEVGGLSKRFILSSGASEKLQCKSPYDLMQMTNLFDSKFKSNKIQNCMGQNVLNVLEKAKNRNIVNKRGIEVHKVSSSKKNAVDKLIPDKELLKELVKKDSSAKDIKQQTRRNVVVSMKAITKAENRRRQNAAIGKKKNKKGKKGKQKLKVKPFKR